MSPFQGIDSSDVPLRGKTTAWLIEGGSHLALFIALLSSAFIAMGLISLPPTNVTAIWLPAGVALLAMLRGLSWRALPTIWLANCAVVYAVNGYPLTEFRPFTWLLALVNTCSPALSYAAWRAWIPASPFLDGKLYLRFVAGVALVPNLITAWLVIAIIHWAGFLQNLTWPDFIIRSAINTLSSALAILLLVPLGWYAHSPEEGRFHRILPKLALSAAASLLVTWGSFHLSGLFVALAIPLILFVALLGGPRAVAVAVLTFSLYGLISVTNGSGPILNPKHLNFEPVLAMALFAFALSLPGQYAGIVQAALRRQQESLEETVRKRTLELSETEEQLRLAIDAVSDGIFDWRVEDDTPRCNNAFYRMLGFPPNPKGLPWRRLRKFVHPRDRVEVNAALHRTFSGETDYFESEARVRTRRDGWIWVRGRGKVVARDSRGRATRFVGATTNITTERLRLQALAEARDRAEVAERAKSDFLATMSHEIRTPLNGVVGFTELLRTTELSEEQTEFVGAVQSSGRVLLTLLNDILDLSKMEAGAMDLESDPCNLAMIVREVTNLFEANAMAKGVELRARVEPNFPETVLGDSVRLRQILANLVSNAVKFTEQGSVKVSLRTGTTPEGNTVCLTEVSDTGIGIAENQMERLFGHFQQADSSTTRRYGGSGLGLSIARRLARLMGGEITARSELGRGSTFTLMLPLDQPIKVDDIGEEPLQGSLSPAGLEHSGLHLLVVEDNRLNQRLISAFLDKHHHSHVVASDGEEGLSCFSRERFDAVLLDLQMPRRDGISTCREMRRIEARENRPHTPVIAITAAASEEDEQACLEAGMDAFTTKPLKFGELADFLNELPGMRHGAR